MCYWRVHYGSPREQIHISSSRNGRATGMEAEDWRVSAIFNTVMVDNKNITSISLNSHVMKRCSSVAQCRYKMSGEVCVDVGREDISEQGHMTNQLSQVAFNLQAHMSYSKEELKKSVFTLNWFIYTCQPDSMKIKPSTKCADIQQSYLKSKVQQVSTVCSNNFCRNWVIWLIIWVKMTWGVAACKGN